MAKISGVLYYIVMDTSTHTCLVETTLCVVQGDDENFRLTFTKGDDTPLDLTGATLQFLVVNSRTDTEEPRITQAITDITDPTAGIAMLSLSATQTDLPIATYYYKIKLTDQAGKRKTIMKGEFVVEWAK